MKFLLVKCALLFFWKLLSSSGRTALKFNLASSVNVICMAFLSSFIQQNLLSICSGPDAMLMQVGEGLSGQLMEKHRVSWSVPPLKDEQGSIEYRAGAALLRLGMEMGQIRGDFLSWSWATHRTAEKSAISIGQFVYSEESRKEGGIWRSVKWFSAVVWDADERVRAISGVTEVHPCRKLHLGITLRFTPVSIFVS